VASVFVTGSASGIGLEAARQLVAAGHRVVLHGRSQRRADHGLQSVPGAAGAVVGDLSVIAGIQAVAGSANVLGPYDAVIHNAGVYTSPQRQVIRGGGERIFTVNVLAPYLLTALMPLPSRLVYLSSGLESAGRVNLADLQWEDRPWSGMQAYCDSKLYDVMLAFAVARRSGSVIANAVDPGWVKTAMGGPGAPDTIPEGADTPVWLASSDEAAALRGGRLVRRRAEAKANPAAYDVGLQEALLNACAGLTGTRLPHLAG
jgi:NAD(P)-dependent dehydrogenase (short-subunit alcohol dehydrogenase family)